MITVGYHGRHHTARAGGKLQCGMPSSSGRGCRRNRRPIIVTKLGKPLAKLMPVDEEPIDILGRMAGSIKICGDVVGPIEDVE
jgi:hypothetical protein